MEQSRKLLIGFDLCEDYTQISCYSYKTFEPESVCQTETEEENACLIPTALCLKNNSDLWLIGEEAMACAKNKEGILVNHLYQSLQSGETVMIEGKSYPPDYLLEKYFRKAFALIKRHFPSEPITKIVITIANLKQDLVRRIYEALSELDINKDRALVISHSTAFLYYVLSQDKSLWVNDVGLFEFDKHGCNFYQLALYRRSQLIAKLSRKDLSDTLNYEIYQKKAIDIGYTFETMANTVLYKQMISTLYFTGAGFEAGWSEATIKKLCRGRRAFLGQNLYSIGACYAAKELFDHQKFQDILLLNEEMIAHSVSVKVYSDARFAEIPITDAAVPWYEVNGVMEVIPDEAFELEIIQRNILTKEAVRERIPLPLPPQRPNRLTRLRLHLTCSDPNTAHLTVYDLGFGDQYPGSGKLDEFMIQLT